mgnify:CR=1 FL=1
MIRGVFGFLHFEKSAETVLSGTLSPGYSKNAVTLLFAAKRKYPLII